MEMKKKLCEFCGRRAGIRLVAEKDGKKGVWFCQACLIDVEEAMMAILRCVKRIAARRERRGAR